MATVSVGNARPASIVSTWPVRHRPCLPARARLTRLALPVPAHLLAARPPCLLVGHSIAPTPGSAAAHLVAGRPPGHMSAAQIGRFRLAALPTGRPSWRSADRLGAACTIGRPGRLADRSSSLFVRPPGQAAMRLASQPSGLAAWPPGRSARWAGDWAARPTDWPSARTAGLLWTRQQQHSELVVRP